MDFKVFSKTNMSRFQNIVLHAMLTVYGNYCYTNNMNIYFEYYENSHNYVNISNYEQYFMWTSSTTWQIILLELSYFDRYRCVEINENSHLVLNWKSGIAERVTSVLLLSLLKKKSYFLTCIL